MKKLILSVLVAGSLVATSCKKAKEAGDAAKEGAEKTVEATKKVADETSAAVKEGAEALKEGAEKVAKTVESAISGVSIPEFKDPKVGEYVAEYANYAKDYIDAKGDVLKNTDLAKRSTELVTKGQKILQGLDAEETKKYTTVMNSIMSKMADAAK